MTVRRALVRRPLLDPKFRFAVVPDQGVILLSPAEDVLLQGSLYETLIPLLDGARTTDAIVDALGTTVDAAEVYYALGRLQAKGLINAAPSAVNSRDKPRRRAASPERATQLVTVSIDRGAAQRALRAAGWRASARAQTWLVIADDILAPELLTVAATAKRAGRSWLLIVPHLSTPSVGPVFTADGPCFVCLSHRVHGNRPLDAFLRRLNSAPRYASSHVSLLNGAMLRRVLNRAAAVLDRARRESTLDTWNEGSRRWEQHAVPRRPQCPVCGDATIYARSSRVAFQTRDDPALGAVSLTLRDDLVERVTGVVTALAPHPLALEPLHICVAASSNARSRNHFKDVLQDLQQQPSGRGTTPADAAASALGEAVERYSGVWQGDEPRTRSSLYKLRDRGIHPNDVMCFSAAQLRRHRASAESPLTRTPRRFDPNARMDWTPVYSLIRNEERWLPSALLYYGHPEATLRGYCFADSNGCAAGETRADALASALLELVERDAVAIWWYNRLQRPSLDIASARDPWCDAMVQALRTTGREVWALDLTNDLAIPAVAAVARRLTGPEKILLGFGAHTDWRLAVRRALGELGQMFAGTDDGEPDEHLSAEMRDWLTQATLRRHPYLRPRAIARRVKPIPADGGTLAQRILDRLHAHGFDVLALDQTRPDVRVPVVRAIVPGLRHFWPRFGAGRLYDVPIAMRWLREKRREKELNPTACFL